MSTGFSPTCNVHVTFKILLTIIIIIFWLLQTCSHTTVKMRANTSIPESEMSSQKGEWKAYSALMIFENSRVSLSSKKGG